MGVRGGSLERLRGDLLRAETHAEDGEGCGHRPILRSPETMGQGQPTSPHHTT